ncbi:glutathione S-transferase [Nitrobacteraceae bacterium AZCC 1564]
MQGFRLHYFPESGNSYKLALMLALCGQTFEPVWTDFGGGITRTPQWRHAVNEMGEIPVLEIDGVRHTQTAPILLRLADQFGAYGGETEAQKREVLRWLFWDNQKLSGFMATYRYHRAFTPSPDPAVLKYFKARLEDFMGILEGHVARQDFIAGDKPTVADISMIAYLHYPEDESGFMLSATHPEIRRWLDRVAAIPGWKPAYDLLPGKRLKRYR